MTTDQSLGPAKLPVPGPYPAKNCPPPTEVACIETNYIYDSCFMPVQRELTGAIPPVALPVEFDPDNDYSVVCQVESLACDEVDRTLANGADGNIYNVTLRLQYSVQVTILQNGTEFFQGILGDVFFRTIKLCAPTGATVDCSRFSTVQGQAFVISFDEEPTQATIQVNASVCLIAQSYATVQLLVPSYGFCIPTECSEEPISTPCPPDLFPPVCSNTGNNT